LVQESRAEQSFISSSLVKNNGEITALEVYEDSDTGSTVLPIFTLIPQHPISSGIRICVERSCLLRLTGSFHRFDTRASKHLALHVNCSAQSGVTGYYQQKYDNCFLSFHVVDRPRHLIAQYLVAMRYSQGTSYIAGLVLYNESACLTWTFGMELWRSRSGKFDSKLEVALNTLVKSTL